MSLHVNDSGTWKQAQEVHVNDGGTWKSCLDVYVNDGGTWKSALYESGSQNFTTAGSTTFTVPAGVYSLTATIVGGGGGGGGNDGSGDNRAGGGGGSGGYYENVTISVTPSEQLSIVVGEGGTRGSFYFNGNSQCSQNSGSTGSKNADDGEDSSISRGSTVLYSAGGGGGGVGNTGDSGNGAAGAGGTPNGTAGDRPHPIETVTQPVLEVVTEQDTALGVIPMHAPQVRFARQTARTAQYY